MGEMEMPLLKLTYVILLIFAIYKGEIFWFLINKFLFHLSSWPHFTKYFELVSKQNTVIIILLYKIIFAFILQGNHIMLLPEVLELE